MQTKKQARAHHERLITSATGPLSADLRRSVSTIFRDTIGFIASLQGRRAPKAKELRDVIRQSEELLLREFKLMLEAGAEKVRRDKIAQVSEQLTPPMLRRVTGLPIDTYGNVKPRPGPDPGIIRNDPSFEDFIARAAPLLHINGDAKMERRSPTITEIMGDPKEVDVLVSSFNKSISDRWDRKVIRILDSVSRTLARQLVEVLNRDGTFREIRKKIRDFIDSRRFKSLRRLLDIEARHEVLRQRRAEQDDLEKRLPPDVYAGFILHSVHQREPHPSAPDHVARDGWRFYRDDRPEADAPWKDRLIPPYRKNCLCFTIDIFEDPQGEEYFAEFEAVPQFRGARRIRPQDVGGSIWVPGEGFQKITADQVGTTIGQPNAPALTPRDVGSWRDWFNDQRPGIQELAVGTERFVANGLAVNGRRHRYEDYVGGDGAYLSPSELVFEKKPARDLRRELVRQVIDRLGKQHQKAWSEGGDKWKYAGQDEAIHKKQMRSFLKRIEERRSAKAS